jgi:2-oxoglutarate-Fe(II)-dependent oxygenase superfamily protein
VHVVEFTRLRSLEAKLADVPDDAVVLAVPPGTNVVSLDAARHAYDGLFGTIVLAATAVARVSDELAARHPTTETPWRFVAGDALAGPAASLRALAANATDDDDDATFLTERYLAGADLELDVGAELFLVLGPNASAPVVVGFGVYDPSPRRATCVANEIVAVPFWDARTCALVIEAAEAAHAWASDPDDPVPGNEVPLAVVSERLFTLVEQQVEATVVPALRTVWPEFAWNGLHDAFVIRYEPGPDAELPLHHDVAQISASIRLNDGYAGGALEFPRQAWDNSAVPVGELVAWPSLVTHPHRARPVASGVKYGLTLWFALPD